MILWNTTLRTRVPTYPEDGGSRLFRNVGFTYQVTRRLITNGRIFTLIAMITPSYKTQNSCRWELFIDSSSVRTPSFSSPHPKLLLTQQTVDWYGPSCDSSGGMTGLRTARKMNRGSIPNRCTRWLSVSTLSERKGGGGHLHSYVMYTESSFTGVKQPGLKLTTHLSRP
jgi:hypothetical protein